MLNIELKNERLNDGVLKYTHLVGKEFKLGTRDCYSMAVNMFKDNLNIELSNYARPTDFWNYDGINIYVDNFANEGFELVKKEQNVLRPFDVLLVAIPNGEARHRIVTNHCLIYLDDGYVIHHRLNCLSAVESYTGALKNLTTHHLRHKDVPDMSNASKPLTKVDLRDFMLPSKRRQLQELERMQKEEEDRVRQ